VIGELSRRVTLERPDRTEDGGGGASVTWTPIATVWAAVTAAAAGEITATDDVASRVRHVLRIRWRADVRAGWRAVLDGRALRIRASVDRDGAKHWLVLDAEEEAR